MPRMMELEVLHLLKSYQKGKRSELANPTYLSVNRLVSFVANQAHSLYNYTLLFYDHTHYVWHFIPRQSLFVHFKLK